MNAQTEAELASLQGVLEFKAELTAANHKSVVAGHAMIKADMAYMVSVEDIHVLEGFNPRIKDAGYWDHVHSLKESIKENGFYPDKPLAGFGAMLGKKAVIYVTEGHCRLAAVKLAIEEGAPISEVPMVLGDKSTNMEDLTVALVRGNEGRRFTPIELAVVCKRLSNFGWAPSKIAQKLGVSTEYVSQLLTLAGAPSQIREMVQQGNATAAVALGAMRSHGAEAGAVLDQALQEAQAKGKTKLTAKFMPEQRRKSVLVKTAPRMFDALEQIQANKVYSTLPAEITTLIDELLTQVKAAMDEAKPPQTPAAT